MGCLSARKAPASLAASYRHVGTNRKLTLQPGKDLFCSAIGRKASYKALFSQFRIFSSLLAPKGTGEMCFVWVTSEARSDNLCSFSLKSSAPAGPRENVSEGLTLKEETYLAHFNPLFETHCSAVELHCLTEPTGLRQCRSRALKRRNFSPKVFLFFVNSKRKNPLREKPAKIRTKAPKKKATLLPRARAKLPQHTHNSACNEYRRRKRNTSAIFVFIPLFAFFFVLH